MTDAPVAGRFVIQRRIGAGGMGVVYEAWDRTRQQTVALKKLPEPDSAGLYRLKREFRSLADVAHPNLVPLYELVVEQNDWFFTMELVEGVDFLRYLRSASSPAQPSTDENDEQPTWKSGEQPTLTSGEAVPTLLTPVEGDDRTVERVGSEDPPTLQDARVARRLSDERPFGPRVHLPSLRAALRQLTEGIIALHNAGKLHRDLKPSNVLVRPDGHVVILDFGLVEDLDPLRKGDVALAGTPVYMSPEQNEESPSSTASDWYAVGVMLYEALSGILPFDGDFYSMMLQKRSEVSVSPRDLAGGVPEDLSDLCMALLARSPERRPTGAEILARLDGSAAAPAAVRPSLNQSVFVGRERELADLWRAYSVVRNGGVATAVVRGRSGLGKSALVHHFLSALRHRDGDAVVLRGRCYQQESVPYKALDSLIDDLLHYTERLSPLELKGVVPADIGMLARVFPVLEPLEAATRRRSKSAVDVLDSQEVRRRAVAALREIFARLAEAHPVVLFIDDIQWGDRDSAVVLAALLQPPDAPPMLTVLSHRSDEAGPRLFLDELQRLRERGVLGEVLDIPILELTLDESRQLATLLGGSMPEERLQSIAREAEGSPMFVGEMVRFVTAMGGEQAPADLDDLIRLRVAAMPATERQVLEMLAVAGQPLQRNVLHAAVGGEIGTAILALRSEHMIRSRVVDAHEALDASHDRFREAVLASMPVEDRRARHLRLAMALEGVARRDPEMLATHYAAAGDSLTGAQYAAEAAGNASAALAFDHAARLYRFALDLHPSIANAAELRIQLAESLTRAGRGFEAAPIYLDVAQTAEPQRALELRRRAAENLLSGGHVERGLAVMEQVLASVGLKLPATPRRSVLAIVVQRLRLALRGQKYRERPVAEIPADLLLRVDVCWAVAIGLARVDNIRAAYFQALHLRLALEAGDPYRVARALAVEAGYSSVGGGKSRRRTAAIVRRAESHARRLNHPHLIGLAALAHTFGTLFLGRFRAALEKANEAEKVFRERCTGVAWEIDTTQSCSLCALYYLGNLTELAPRMNKLLREAEDRGDRYGGWSVAGRPSIVWLALDDPDTALRINQTVIARWSSDRFQSQHLFELLASAQIDLYLGRPAEAWQRLAKSWPAMVHAKILRVQFVRNEMLHLRARVGLAVALGTGDRTVLRQVERDAAAIVKTQMEWALPLAQCVRAGVRSIHGDVDESRQLLREAVRNFEKAEMMLYAAIARRRLGTLTGGDEGAAMVTEADRWLRSQLVKIPERMAEVLAPGFR
jgi:eukaryotic-like serine/threonine-protein kinase